LTLISRNLTSLLTVAGLQVRKEPAFSLPSCLERSGDPSCMTNFSCYCHASTAEQMQLMSVPINKFHPWGIGGLCLCL